MSSTNSVVDVCLRDKVRLFFRWYSKCEHCFIVEIAYREISKRNDIHTDKHIKTLFANVSVTHRNITHIQVIRKSNIHQVSIDRLCA